MPKENKKRPTRHAYRKVKEAVDLQLSRLQNEKLFRSTPDESNQSTDPLPSTSYKFPEVSIQSTSNVLNEIPSTTECPYFENSSSSDSSAYSETSYSSSEEDNESDEINEDNLRNFFKPIEKMSSLAEDLHQWVLSHRITGKAVTGLLKILKKHEIGNLPEDSRSFLKTPRGIKTLSVGNGEYLYLGIKENICNILSKLPNLNLNVSLVIDLFANIDGLPIAKSSSSQLWPILVKCNIFNQNFIFAVAVFFGHNTPKDLDFLKPFVQEINELRSGFFLQWIANYYKFDRYSM